MASGIDLAHKLVEEKKDARSGCLKLRFINSVIGTTEGQQASLCLYTAAQLLRDPQICLGAVVTEYGLDCIGQIWGEESDKSKCNWFEKNAVRCVAGPGAFPKTFLCDANKAPGDQPDECFHRIAFKKKDPNFCGKIQNATLEKVCRVRIQVWSEYPELRNLNYFND